MSQKNTSSSVVPHNVSSQKTRRKPESNFKPETVYGLLFRLIRILVEWDIFSLLLLAKL